MDYSKFKLLEKEVLYDLKEFVPNGHFKTTTSLKYNGKELSRDEIRGMLAMSLADRLFSQSESQVIAVTPRQSIAIELLYCLGDLATIEYRNPLDPDRDTVLNSLFTYLEEYLLFFSQDEAKPFESLLPNRSNTQSIKLGVQIRQEDEILRIIKEVYKYDPLNLPQIVAGKPWIKSEIFKAFFQIPTELFRSGTVFNKAWERLRDSGRIKEIGQ
ncbi:hypothetical protein SAMN05216302_10816 [Nitrosomonas aestuarii]|uniref:Uncharacterized protein n=1 Tax=Nitrosomonas aestuarii TaxID=52441 RepID=A0A1I4HF16_9PROT|nr:hypothetical protein [Nitrosomonas aestuarii]SFL40899.1 hypothetical protein SAMN05216302_10816 [Nitrosomonas aestuarii]